MTFSTSTGYAIARSTTPVVRPSCCFSPSSRGRSWAFALGAFARGKARSSCLASARRIDVGAWRLPCSTRSSPASVPVVLEKLLWAQWDPTILRRASNSNTPMPYHSLCIVAMRRSGRHAWTWRSICSTLIRTHERSRSDSPRKAWSFDVLNPAISRLQPNSR